MDLKQIIKEAIEVGDVCGEYQERVSGSRNLKDIMHILMDANGIEWIWSMGHLSNDIDLRDELLRRAKAFINGRHREEYINSKGNGYSTMLYVGEEGMKEEEIVADSTILCLLRFQGHVRIPKNAFVKLYVDGDSRVHIFLEKNAKCMVNCIGNGMAYLDGESISKDITIDK